MSEPTEQDRTRAKKWLLDWMRVTRLPNGSALDQDTESLAALLAETREAALDKADGLAVAVDENGEPVTAAEVHERLREVTAERDHWKEIARFACIIKEQP